MSNAKHSPDLLFEVSWEVCNKVGGIHTVISTKAQTVTRKFADRYVLLGPDLSHEGVNPEFEEDPNQLKAWRQSLYNEGIRVRVGRWKIKGEPTVILVDFTSLIPRKDEILKSLWESYHVDSISGQWDYIEPVLFGWAAGVVIASYVETFGTPTEKAVAHFHEWMTAAGGLYLRKHAPYIATVFTTHATVMGRCIAGNRLPLYNDLPKFNADELARQFNVTAKHSIEKMAAAYHDAFLTVSDITANECKYLLGREPDGVTPNGFENDFVWAGEEYYAKRDEARRAMISVAEACLGEKFTGDPLIVGTSGRYEFRNKAIKFSGDGPINVGGFNSDQIIRNEDGGFISRFYGYVADGLFQNWEEVYAHTDEHGTLIQPNAKPGDIRFKDRDHNGVLDANDKDYIGNPYPDLMMGLNIGMRYKNIDFAANFYGTFGNDIYNVTKGRYSGSGGQNVWAGTLEKAWHGEGTGNDIPRLSSNDLNLNYSRVSSFYVEDGSYLRCKLLQIGYTLPKKWVGGADLRLSFSAQNPFTITGYSGMDPERPMVDGTTDSSGSAINTGIDNVAYPNPRTFLFGIDFKF